MGYHDITLGGKMAHPEPKDTPRLVKKKAYEISNWSLFAGSADEGTREKKNKKSS